MEQIGMEDIASINEWFIPMMKSILGKDTVVNYKDNNTTYDYDVDYNDFVGSVYVRSQINLKDRATTPEEAFAIVAAAIPSNGTRTGEPRAYKSLNNRDRYGTDYTFALPDGRDLILTVDTYFAEYKEEGYGVEVGDLIADLDGYHYIV